MHSYLKETCCGWNSVEVSKLVVSSDSQFHLMSFSSNHLILSLAFHL